MKATARTSGVTVQGNVPTQATRDRILAALPYPETKLVLDDMPMPNQPINDVIGRYTDAKSLVRRDNTFLGKVDFEAGTGRLSVTASRMRPFAAEPRINLDNDQEVHERIEARLDAIRAHEERVGLREPVRLEPQYARSR